MALVKVVVLRVTTHSIKNVSLVPLDASLALIVYPYLKLSVAPVFLDIWLILTVVHPHVLVSPTSLFRIDVCLVFHHV